MLELFFLRNPQMATNFLGFVFRGPTKDALRVDEQIEYNKGFHVPFLCDVLVPAQVKRHRRTP